MSKSNLEERFLLLWNYHVPDDPPEREHRFHSVRRWRFDFAWPARMVAVEIEGGTFGRGRHISGVGHHADCDKYNAAAAQGWKVIRLTAKHLPASKTADAERTRVEAIDTVLSAMGFSQDGHN